MLSPVWFPVPPTGYGGIEWVVALLADGLVEAGHEVTLFASGDSQTKARLVSVYEEAPSERIGTSVAELRHALACYERAGEFDVVNDHSGLRRRARRATVETPVVHTVHGPLDGEAGADLRADRPRGSRRRPHLALAQPAQAASPTCPGSRTARTRSTSTRIPCSRTAATTSSSSAA